MKKLVFYILPAALLLIIFILIMQGGYYDLTARNEKNTIPQCIEQLDSHLHAGNWDDAQETLNRLNVEWEKNLPRIQYHAEITAIEGIKRSIARLNGAILAQDLGLCLVELGELTEHWKNLKD